jgi:hypothetical protein
MQPEQAVQLPTSRAKALMTLFGLKYPIFEAPHGPTVTSPELAIAVSNAGAMGAIALTDIPPDKARAVVSKIRAATRGSFFVNYILAVLGEKEPSSLRVVLDAGAPIVQFSWGLPTKESISAIRSAGAKLWRAGLGAAGDDRGLDALTSVALNPLVSKMVMGILKFCHATVLRPSCRCNGRGIECAEG